jgi:cephalosporin hydroxylase
VKSAAQGYQRVLVMLDSNHTHEHVLAELQAYAPLVGRDSYCIVFDTVIDDTPSELIENRPWGVGNNPKTAMYQYLQSTDRFVVDEAIHQKLLITVARQGYLKCIKD